MVEVFMTNLALLHSVGDGFFFVVQSIMKLDG